MSGTGFTAGPPPRIATAERICIACAVGCSIGGPVRVSIALIQIEGATPITSISTAIGHKIACSPKSQIVSGLSTAISLCGP